MASYIVRLVTAIGLAGLLALNVATVTVPAVASLVASAVASVLGQTALIPEFRPVYYRGKAMSLAEAAADTAQRVSSRIASGAARSARSVLAESIPIAGIAVVVGSTTWHLKDACESMQDLRALEVAANATASEDPKIAEVCGMQVPTKEMVWEIMKESPSQAWDVAKTHVPDLPELKLPSWWKLVDGLYE